MSTALATKKSSKRNKRVPLIDRETWKRERNAFYRRNIRYAAAAKATRSALGIAQREIAKHLDLSVQAICNRESGRYAWQGGDVELVDYQKACMRLAGIRCEGSSPSSAGARRMSTG